MMRFAQRLQIMADRLAQAGERAAMNCARQGMQIAREKAAVDSGALRDSIAARQEEGYACVSAGASHAPMVEYGTSRFYPRPFMQPMAEEMRPVLIDEAARALREVLQ